MAGIRRIDGGRHVDGRGTLRFCNDFDMAQVRRVYTIANSADAPVRGWIGHRRETKWFFPLKGETTIVAEPMDGGSSEAYMLKAEEPAVVEIPGGYWFKIMQDGGSAEVLVFSDCRAGEFANDDFRRPL